MPLQPLTARLTVLRTCRHVVVAWQKHTRVRHPAASPDATARMQCFVICNPTVKFIVKIILLLVVGVDLQQTGCGRGGRLSPLEAPTPVGMI